MRFSVSHLITQLRSAEIDMADTVTPEHVSNVINDTSWTIQSTHHTVLKASLGAAIFGRDMLFDIPFVVDW